MSVDDRSAETRSQPTEPSDATRHRGSSAGPAALWAFGFLIVRLFAVSGYDWETAFAVSTTLGIGDGLALVFGSLMAEHLAVALVLIFALPLLIGTYLWSPDGRRPVVALAGAVGLLILVAHLVSFRSWWLPLATGAVFGVFALANRLPDESRVRKVAMAGTRRVGLVVGLGVLLIALFVQTPWVPLERIETTEGIVTGYVLSVDSGYLNVLTDDHEFLIILSSDVRSRTDPST